MNKKTKKSIYGFFVAMGNEIPSLKEKMTVNSGRFGVFYKKEQLISTIKPKKIIINMEIVEVLVEEDAIVRLKNEERFGIKKGKNVPIVTIESIEKVLGRKTAGRNCFQMKESWCSCSLFLF